MSNEQIERIEKVFRVPLKGGGFQFTDQKGSILRKKATRPYTHMSVRRWVNNETQFVAFHSTLKAAHNRQHFMQDVLRVIQVEEPGIASTNSQFVVKGIVNEGWADSAFLAAKTSGATVVKFQGTEITMNGDQEKFQEAFNLICQGQLPCPGCEDTHCETKNTTCGQ